MSDSGSTEPWGMLDEAPLPERYGQDIIHVSARDPITLHVYWEVTPSTRERVRTSVGTGRLTVRLVAIGRGEHGIELPGRSEDVAVATDVGAIFLPWPSVVGGDIERVRAVLGLTSEAGAFVPVAESPICTVPPEGPSDPDAPRPKPGSAHSPWRLREQA